MRWFDALVTIALAVTIAGCAESAYVPPPSSAMPPIVAGVRKDFRKHWPELLADPSPAAARTRAEVVAWSIQDIELHTMLTRNASIESVLARAIVDGTKAAEAFPDAADVWLILAKLRAHAGDSAGAEKAACRARELDARSPDASTLCPDRPRLATRAPARLDAVAKSSPSRDPDLRSDLRGDLHVALAAAERRVPAVCEKSASALSWAELVVCGDDDARRGRKPYARYRYRAAVLATSNEEAQFLALQRIEEMDGSCKEVLDTLPSAQAKKYERWKTTLGARIRPPLRSR